MHLCNIRMMKVYAINHIFQGFVISKKNIEKEESGTNE